MKNGSDERIETSKPGSYPQGMGDPLEGPIGPADLPDYPNPPGTGPLEPVGGPLPIPFYPNPISTIRVPAPGYGAGIGEYFRYFAPHAVILAPVSETLTATFAGAGILVEYQPEPHATFPTAFEFAEYGFPSSRGRCYMNASGMWRLRVRSLNTGGLGDVVFGVWDARDPRLVAHLMNDRQATGISQAAITAGGAGTGTLLTLNYALSVSSLLVYNEASSASTIRLQWANIPNATYPLTLVAGEKMLFPRGSVPLAGLNYRTTAAANFGAHFFH